MTRTWLLLLLMLMAGAATAQTAPQGAHVSGRLTFEDGATRYNQVRIYNRRTGTFITPVAMGFFELFGYKTDTFIFVSQGYEVQNISYKDSLIQREYELNVTMHRLHIEMTGISITPDKTFEQIQQQIDDLGVKNTDTYKDINEFASPISALYELFSKTEKEKREVAALENEDMRRRVMRELLKICVKSNLIDLPFSEVDSFIDYCNFTDEYMQHTGLYDMLSNIKLYYRYYKEHYR